MNAEKIAADIIGNRNRKKLSLTDLSNNKYDLDWPESMPKSSRDWFDYEGNNPNGKRKRAPGNF